ncbi:sulfatase [Radiobacillus sp. PE A8.2]|uniref:sulfatase family protein n=1 Tax=Radiobacillus sp. PE A8.2 TaxID=3380349 RepID=UPI00388FF9C5
MNNKPNIIFVFADQLRADVLPCYGDMQAITPGFEKLASESLVYHNAIANAPVCGPSRASLLTGCYPLEHKVVVNDMPLTTERDTIAKKLKQTGYKTGYIGKWHLDGMPRDKFTPPGDRRQGFDDYWAVYNCSHEYFDTKYYKNNPDLITSNSYEPVHQTKLAIECINEWSKFDQPFCLFLSWGPPHDPYDQVPKKYKELYSNIEPKDNCASFDHDQLRDYYAQVSALDDQLELLLDCTKDLGIEENTIFVFTSDHGDMLGSHGYQLKQLPFEESIHVPLFIKWTNHIEAGVTDELIGITDLTPTILGLAGIDSSSEMSGVDLSANITTGSGIQRDSIPIMNIVPGGNAFKYGESEPWRGIRTKRYTYARFRSTPWILYDNTKDPQQLNNMIDDEIYSEIKDTLEKELINWLFYLDDEFLSGEEHLNKILNQQI